MIVRQVEDTPVFIFDGRCGFCRRWVERWKMRTGDATRYVPRADADALLAEHHLTSESNFTDASYLIEPDGTLRRGAAAVLANLARSGHRVWWWRAYQNAEPVRAASDFAYTVISHHRGLFNFLDQWLLGKRPSTYAFTAWIYFRALGLIFLAAFWSLAVQIQGLCGSDGIMPISPWLAAVHKQLGSSAYLRVPTLLWFGSSDHALQLVCGLGIGFSVLLVIGVAPIFVLVALWALYLSITVTAQPFLGFQWDALLLETAVLSIFFAPATILPRRLRNAREPSPVGRWLLRWLLFRLMVASGAVKIASGDAAWHAWTALRYHYFTQPLPTWTSWYFHQLPPGFQAFSVGFMFFAELIAPLGIFGPRRLRAVAFAGICTLQILIALTGNYGFFNLLTLTLCLTVMDDQFFSHFVRLKPPALLRPPSRAVLLTAIPALALFLMSLIPFTQSLQISPEAWPQLLLEADTAVEPFESVNSYGLFAVMTTQRREIVIEGSDDQANWKPYGFKWKPGDPKRRPEFCTPHMPRLDWQMWFAALGSADDNPWFTNLIVRLLQGSPSVLKLMGENPFPDHPPRYIRAVVYQYEFTDFEERRASGDWWKREMLGLYFPAVSQSQIANP